MAANRRVTALALWLLPIFLLASLATARAETTVQVVAHPDDVLYFINPAALRSIEAGETTWMIYLTAGDSNLQIRTVDGTNCPHSRHWQCRELGLQAAYAAMAGGAGVWEDAPLDLNGRSIERRYLLDRDHVNLVFLRIRSPAHSEIESGTLELLWDARADCLATVKPGETVYPSFDCSDPSVTYTKQQLIETLAALYAMIEPDVIRTLDPGCLPEVTGEFVGPPTCIDVDGGDDGVTEFYFTQVLEGDDHSEHVNAARFALAARASLTRTHEVRSYRTYNTSDEPQNLSGEEIGANEAANNAYAVFDKGGVPRDWNHRVIARESLSGFTGAIAFIDTSPPTPEDDDCLEVQGSTVPGTSIGLAACTGSPAQRFEVRSDAITQGGLCLTSHLPSSGASLELCTGAPEQSWTWWSHGMIRNVDGRCLGVTGTTLTVALCEWPDRVWELRATTAAAVGYGTEFSALEFGTEPSLYGSLRFGDVNGDGLADACARRTTAFYCALATAGGTFAAASQWIDNYDDVRGWGPVAYGSTIMLGDLDGDGDADVCGRGIEGLICAISDGSSFGPVTDWTPVFGDDWGGDAPEVYSSLRMGDIDGDGDADVCGFDLVNGNVVCVRSQGTEFDKTETKWFDS